MTGEEFILLSALSDSLEALEFTMPWMGDDPDLKQILSPSMNQAKNLMPEGEYFVDRQTIRAAMLVVSPALIRSNPWISPSDEGCIMFQWQRDEEGVALFFCGDDEFSISTKSGPYDYYTNSIERRVSEGLPLDIVSRIICLAT